VTDLYYAAACQTDFPCPESRSEIGDRVRRMAAIIEQTITGYEPFFDVRLLTFPEFAHAVPIHQKVDDLRRHLAVPVPNEHTDVYAKLASHYGCYIQTGSFLEVDDNYPGALFNTTVLIGPEGVLSKYRKINTWIPWEVHTSPHDLPDYAENPFPVVDTELGRLGVATCYDWLFPETIRQIAFNGAEPIRKSTLEGFCTAFRDCGFRRDALYSVYGLAEATVFVCARQWSDQPTSSEAVPSSPDASRQSKNRPRSRRSSTASGLISAARPAPSAGAA